MASAYVDSVSGVTIYLKPATDGAPAVSSPWGGDVVNGTWDGTKERWTFTVTAGVSYLAYQRLGGSPASGDIEVGYISDISASVPGDIPAPVIPGVCTVRFMVTDIAGVPVEGCYVNVWLEDGNSLVDNAMISRTPVKERTNSSGYVDIDMIQLAEFKRGGTYVVQVSDPSGRRLRESRVRVPLLETCYADQLTEL